MKNKISISKSEIDKLAELTEQNAHTKARIYLTILLGAKDLEKCYRAVNDLHIFFGNLPYGLSQVRDELDGRLFQYVEENCSKAQAEAVNNAF